MVYCGKPSKACAPCRARKTKCDLSRPACIQCRRACRVCPGYRDELTLAFRNQNEDIKRLYASTKPKRVKATVPKSNGPTRTALVPVNGNAPALTAAPVVPAEVQGDCFFFRNYILDDKTFPNGYFSYLPSFCSKLPADNPVTSLVTSLGMAVLANTRNSPAMRTTAIAKYAAAIRSMNAALQDPVQASSNSTLIIVVLLGLYEISTSFTSQSLTSWASHVNGAVAILHLRGKEQLQNRIGLELFVQLRAHVAIACLHRGVAMPPKIIELCGVAREFETPMVSSLADIVNRVCSLRAAMRIARDTCDPRKMVASALAVEAELAAWGSNVPPEYVYTPVSLKKSSPEVLSWHYDVYSNIGTASVWNHYRSVRILVHEIILYQLARQARISPQDHYSLSANAIQTQMSKAMLTTIMNGVCDSVPFYLHYHIHGDNWASMQPMPKAATVIFILWPLYCSAVSQYVSDEMLSWITGRLEKIAEVTGVRQAAALAHTMRMRSDIVI